MKSLTVCMFAVIGILGGCAHVMSPEKLALVDRSIPYAELNRNPEALAGKNVLVGGIIAANRSDGDVMQLEVAQLELLDNGVPDDRSSSAGRFLAVSGELLDPLLYRPGMLVTIIGEIKGQKVQKFEGEDYRYPLISAKEIRTFRASDPAFGRETNPYQNKIGDDRHMLRQPGAVAVQPAKP